MLVGEPDPAEHLDAGLGHLDRAVEARRPRRRRRRTPTARRRPNARTDATSQAAAVTASAVSSISAHRCLIAWKPPICWPNCSRTLAYSTAVSRHQRATPEASAAANVTAVRRTSSRGQAGHRRRRSQQVDLGRVRTGGSGRAPIAGVTVDRRRRAPANQRPSASASQQVGRRRGVPDDVESGRARGRRRAVADRGSVGSHERAATAGPSSGAGHQLVRARLERDRLVEHRPPPPPAASGSPIVATPISPTAFHTSANVASASASACARPPRRHRAPAAHLRRLAASSTCSSEIPMDMRPPADEDVDDPN